jgi:prepilin-type processing-associated H-X9-DG protein
MQCANNLEQIGLAAHQYDDGNNCLPPGQLLNINWQDISALVPVLLFLETASSRHPGLVNLLLCDGSVRSVQNSVSPQVWWSLGTIAGGEVVSSDRY